MLKLQFCRQNLLAFNMPKAIFIALIVLASNLRSGESLSCYRCGTLSSNARKIEDCQGPKTVEVCAANEACVVFKRLYKKGSESLRGCYPNDKSLPGLSGSLIPQKPNCVFLPKRRSPVKVCMCTTDLCNANDYNFHTERANRLFGRPQTSEAVKSPFFPPTSGRSQNSAATSSATSRQKTKVTVVTPSSNL